MINADSGQGSVVFGVAPDGQVVGVESGNLDTAQRSIQQTISNKFAPPIQCTMRVLEVDSKRVILLSAQRNRDVPYHEFDGRAFIREGTATRQLNFAEKQGLQRQRNRDLHSGPWKCDRCGMRVGVFSSIVMTDQSLHKSYVCPQCGGEFWPNSR
jgi:predicted RNA-binding Zn-ribbon protein involved in translation (DUF1610 family)